MSCFKKKELQKVKTEVTKPSSYRYPEAMVVPDRPMLKTKLGHSAKDGEYKFYFVHATAGWQNQTGKSFVDSFLKRGLNTDFMEENGNIIVQRPWNKWGSHLGAGKFLGRSISSKAGAGIEIACGGILTKGEDGEYRTWFNKVVPSENRRYVTREQGYVRTGWYEIFTPEQEESLAKFLAHIIRTNPSVCILSHDEVSGYRGKSDVGGCLSLPMQEFIKVKVLPLV